MNIWALWIPKTSDQFSAFPSVSKYLLHSCLHYILGDIPGHRKAGATISGSPRDSPSLWEKRPHMKHLYDSNTFTYNIMNDSLNCAARRGRTGHCVRAFLREVFQEDGELEFQKDGSILWLSEARKARCCLCGTCVKVHMRSQSLLGDNKSLSLGVGKRRGCYYRKTSVFSGHEKLGCPLEVTGQTFQTLDIQPLTEHVLSTYCILGVVLGAGDWQMSRICDLP